MLSSFAARSPSCSRAQKFAFHAIDQPVDASPRRSSERRAPSNSAGVAGLISVPGYSPHRCELWRWCTSTSSKSSCHSMIRPSAFTRVGATRARVASSVAANSASMPRMRAASAVPSIRPRMICRS